MSAPDRPLSAWIDEVDRAARLNPERVAQIRRAAGVGAVLLVALGLVGLVAIATGSSLVAGFGRVERTIAPGTAYAFVVLGVGVLLSVVGRGPRPRRAAAVCGALVALVAAGHLLEAVPGLSWLRVSALFARAVPGNSMSTVTMSAVTAASLVLLGLSVVLHNLGRVTLAQVLVVVPCAVGYGGVASYVFGATRIYDEYASISVSLAAAVGMMVAAVSILFLRADLDPMRVYSGDTAGGRVIRRLAPVVAVLFTAVDALLLAVVRSGGTDLPVALAFAATGTTALAVVIIWVEGARMRTIDVRRAGTEAALRRLREAESGLADTHRRLAATLDSATDAFITMDVEGRITDWNPAAERLYGITAEEARGRRIDECLQVFLRDGQVLDETVDGAYLRAAVTRGPTIYSIIRRDGRLIEVDSRVWSLDLGSERFFTAMVRDVAEQQRARRELLELNRDLDEFATVAAHDLRGPLTAIKGYTEFLRDGAEATGDEDALRATARIDRALGRGQALIDELLAYSRSGHTELRDDRVDLDALVRDAAEDVRARVDRDFSLEVGPLFAAAGDAGLLRQVFDNLLFNAVHYCPPDRTPRLVVDAEVDPGRRQGVVRVCDNGLGIPVEDREAVFGMFQRGRSTPGAGGTGFGLALCRRVLERHGGAIALDDAPGGGARFTLTIPRHFRAREL